MGPSNPARLFGQRNFRLLWTGSFASAVGASLTGVALDWFVFSETHNTFAITILGVATFVPSLLIGLFAGVFADRYDRRRLMLRADVVRALAIAALAGFLVFRGFNLLVIVLTVLAISALGAVFRPASNAILPSLLRGEEIADGNGLLQSGSTVGLFAGSALGGAVILTVGAVAGFSINALTYGLSATMIFLLVVPRSHTVEGPKASEPSLMGELSEGFAYVRSKPGILWTIVASLPGNFLISFYLLYLVVFVQSSLHASAGVFGAALALAALGTGLGALLVGRLDTVRHTGWVFSVTWAGSGLLIAAIALFPSVAVLLVACGLEGVLGGLGNVTYFACLQRVVPGPLLGRVFSIDEVGSFAVIPLGQVAGGILIVTFGVGPTYLLAGLGTTALALLLMTSREVRALGYPPRGETPPAAPEGSSRRGPEPPPAPN